MNKLLLIGIAAAFFFSCKKKETKPTLAEQEARVEAFAEKIATEMNDGRVNVLDKHFDKGVFVNRVVNHQYWDEFLRESGDTIYKSDFKQKLFMELTLGRMFLSNIDGKSYFTYDHVKTYRIDDRWHAVFRIYANDAINYHDCLLRIDTNKVWIEDIYVMTLGAELSKIMQEMYIAGIPDAKGDDMFEDHRLLRYSKLWAERGEYEISLAYFDSISSKFQNSKSLRLYKLQLSSHVPNEAYVRLLEEYEKDFPTDAGTVLIRLDKNFLYGNFPEVLKDLDRLEGMYSADPVIDYLRGNALFGLDNCADAGKSYLSSLNQKPDWEEPFFNWLRCLARNGRNQEAVALIERYQEDFAVSPSYVRLIVSDMPNFLNSSSFRKWKENFEAKEREALM